MLPMVGRLRDLMPKTVKDAPCQEIVRRDGTLDELPILKCWPEDGGRYITLPLVFTKDPETGDAQHRHLSHAGVRRPHHRHALAAAQGRRAASPRRRAAGQAARGRRRAQPGAGADVLRDRADARRARRAAARRLSRRAGASSWSSASPSISKCRPARTSCSKGTSSRASGAARGRSAITPGFYSQPDDFPVFHLTCITQRKKPTYLTTVVGVPPMEDYYLGLASERIFLPMIRKTLPEIVDMHFPAEGIFHNLVIVSIDKRYPGHARKIMNAFWGLGQLMFSKTIIVVDKDVNVHDVSEVAWIVGTHMDPLRDIQMTQRAGGRSGRCVGSAGVRRQDGHRRDAEVGREGYTREWPARLVTTEAAQRAGGELLKTIVKEK